MSKSSTEFEKGTLYLNYTPAVAHFLNGHDPYADFEACGAKLDKLFIRVRKSPNRKGNKVTGFAYFYGRRYTFGVNDYDEMLQTLVMELNFFFWRAHETQVNRRRMYRERWEERHPGETFPWLEQHKQKDTQCKLFYVSA